MEIQQDLKGSVQFAKDHHVPGQVSPIHSHPDADEIYYVIEGEGLFNMVLYRVQAGADRHAEPVPDWPKR